MRNGTGLCAIVLIGLLAACGQRYEEGTHPPRQPASRRTTLPSGHPPVGEGAQATATPQASAADTADIAGVVRIDPQLASRIPSGAVLYLIAREREDGGAPYAFKRIPVPSFPYTFTLGQANIARMLGDGIVFADIPEMYVVAKIDQDGMVGSQPGDLEGRCLQNPVAAGARGLEIVIDRVN